MLVVDDDARVRAALRSLLDEDVGLCCRVVDDAQALGLLLGGAARVDAEVAVVDLSAGTSIQLRLVALLARALPVVVVSMSGAVRPLAMAAGATAFVEKDGDACALLAVVQHLACLGEGGDAPR